MVNILDKITRINIISQILEPTLIILSAVIISLILKIIGGRIIKGIINKTNFKLYRILYEEIFSPIYISVIFIGIYISLLRSIFFPFYYVKATVFTILAVIWGRAFLNFGKKSFEISKKHRKVDEEFIPMAKNIWYVLVLGVVFLSVLSFWEINITPILASAGVLGIIIGFAAKDSVANFFGSIALYFDDTYRVGDWIELDSGESGRVKTIGIRSTVVETRDGVEITIPNSVLNSMSVRNQSSPERKRRISVPVQVEYGTDISKLEKVLLKEAKDQELISDKPDPEVFFIEFGDSSLNFELLCWIKDPGYMPRAKNRLNKSIYKRLNEENINIPFPQRVLHRSENQS